MIFPNVFPAIRHNSLLNNHPTKNTRSEIPSWVLFQNRINKQALFLDDDDELIKNLIRDLRLFPIDEIDDIPDKGTQIKLVLMMVDGSQALFKPKRSGLRSLVGLKVKIIVK